MSVKVFRQIKYFSTIVQNGTRDQGWDEGIALMKVGGKAQLIIPPKVKLVFDVELVSVK